MRSMSDQTVKLPETTESNSRFLSDAVSAIDASAILDRMCSAWDPLVARIENARWLLTAIREERDRTRTEG